MNYRNRQLLDLARGETCACCGADDGTVVAAHSNQSAHGKGMSIKAHDCYIAFLCHRCHSWLDQGSGEYMGMECSREVKRRMFDEAMHATWLRLWEKGLIRVA